MGRIPERDISGLPLSIKANITPKKHRFRIFHTIEGTPHNSFFFPIHKTLPSLIGFYAFWVFNNALFRQQCLLFFFLTSGPPRSERKLLYQTCSMFVMLFRCMA